MSGPGWCSCGCSVPTSQICEVCHRCSCARPSSPCCSTPTLRPLAEGEIQEMVSAMTEASGGRSSLSLPALAARFPGLVPSLPIARRAPGEA